MLGAGGVRGGEAQRHANPYPTGAHCHALTGARCSDPGSANRHRDADPQRDTHTATDTAAFAYAVTHAIGLADQAGAASVLVVDRR